MSMVIHFKMQEDFRTPWPIGINENGVVTSGLGPDDGAWLVGFGPLGEQHITVLADKVADDPARVVDLVPTFSKDGGFFEWQCVVSEVLIYARKPDTGGGDTPPGNATSATS